jgi:hypothetical protein
MGDRSAAVAEAVVALELWKYQDFAATLKSGQLTKKLDIETR